MARGLPLDGLRRGRAARRAAGDRDARAGQRLRKRIGRRLETIVVNGVLPDRFSPEEVAQIAKAAPRRKRPKAVVSEIAQADGRADAQHEQLERLAAEADCPIHELPFLFKPALEPEDVAGLGDVLAPAL